LLTFKLLDSLEIEALGCASKEIHMKRGFVGSFGIAIAISLTAVYSKSLGTRTTVTTKPANQRSEQSLSSHPQQTCCPIVELRQYRLHPGKRDVLIDLFDREFVESQEAVGITVIGQFRDLDDPNRFVWLRGFRDMPARAQSLKEFYAGTVWKANRAAANATMVDTDNVLLLRPALPLSGFQVNTSDRIQPRANKAPEGLVVATTYYLSAPVSTDFVDFFEHTLKPVVRRTGASVLAYFVTEESANTYPGLPVREGEHVFVWFMGFKDQAAYERHAAALARSQRWRGEVSDELARRLKGAPEVLKLSPTARSHLRG
jgi:quinol monooxygenase YgiN